MTNFTCVVENSTLKLNGEITVNSLGKIIKNNESLFAQKILYVDCTNLIKADSSCLAFFLYLQNLNPPLTYNPITYKNMPKHLLLLIDLYNLNALIHDNK